MGLVLIAMDALRQEGKTPISKCLPANVAVVLAAVDGAVLLTVELINVVVVKGTTTASNFF
ncbi:MAG: hypothetical protein A2V96_01175 [Candidatus Yonathbacteria bacterium RBG_16_43_6]|uniref:Uncharacterized protein n=1 Tax=Candidatus Yonathbacteria bacterium RIFCSPLOWO2_01_FULL_43_27 TaxID=1802726 RepID=A0A1G2SE52_9BACT|nr:MAG: hypothetical protein A2V96_01175 [Candidatus Yonathbacteria bacterium RBG_16_43_6]OHA83255.1 MAG: hypothetical protein A3B07_00645 [Candidatus Yonathbacteria bacterium RIFCSPLOWO2_01_FULL_43_27]